MGKRPRAVGFVLAVVSVASAAPARAWSPEAATYGVGETKNVPITMSDGTVLRANVFYPTDPSSGAAASGSFPVIMVQNPYGKDTVGQGSGQSGGAEAGTQTGELPYLIQRGYIDVVVDVRGTGDSQGEWGVFDPVQAQDGATLVNWAAALPNSNGNVGLYGPSYMGIDQFLTASALGPGSPLKALFPIVAGNDLYRDVAFMGGMPDDEFDSSYLALMLATNMGNPVASGNVGDLATVETEHAQGTIAWESMLLAGTMTGGDIAYDQVYWRARNPQGWLPAVAASGVPAFMIGGWYDLFQRGEPLNYSQLQNLAAGLPQNAPMSPGQPVTGRYQLLMGPWYHLTAGTGLDIYALELRWFDRWLKGEDTGIADTASPLHVYVDGAGRWVDVADYPFAEAVPTTYYLQPGGGLSTSAPGGDGGYDTVVYAGANSPCDRQTEQWGAGALAFGLDEAGLPPDPCAQDDATLSLGPQAVTYTTAPLSADTMIAGPIDATIYATSTQTDVELVVTLEDVSPSGGSTPLTSGALLGSFRALDAGATWTAPDGNPLLPYHPYTSASLAPVVPGEVTRYDIEVFPTVAQIPAGDSLRLTITTSDTPHIEPTPPQAVNLVGGVYQIEHAAAAASFLEIPIAVPSAFATACSICQ